MARRFQCPRCGASRYWVLGDGRRRCTRCRFDWRPERLPLRLSGHQWRELLRWFSRGASGTVTAHGTGVNRKRVLRAFTVVRSAILRDVTPEFRAVIEMVDTLARDVGLRGKGLRQALPVVKRAILQAFPPDFRGKLEIDEEFWSRLESGVTGKGGIRRQRVKLYLAEHVWRHRHRDVSAEEQARKLLELLRRRS